jgi:hypothetical protein
MILAQGCIAIAGARRAHVRNYLGRGCNKTARRFTEWNISELDEEVHQVFELTFQPVV